MVSSHRENKLCGRITRGKQRTTQTITVSSNWRPWGKPMVQAKDPWSFEAALGEKGPFLEGVDLCMAVEQWLQAALTQPQRVNPTRRGDKVSSVQMHALPQGHNHLSEAWRLLSHLCSSLAPLRSPCRKLVADRPISCTTSGSRCNDLCPQNQFLK